MKSINMLVVFFVIIVLAIVLATYLFFGSASAKHKVSAQGESNGLSGAMDLSNKGLSANTTKLYAFLQENYGKKIIAGQQADYESGHLIDIIAEVTGKSPALRGFDFMDYSPSRTERGTASRDVDVAIEWWESGGIVTFCWHWNAPKDLIDEGPDKLWWSGFYTKATTFNLAKALADKESEDYRLIIRDMDAIAEQLKRLQQKDIPVLWRPLHEASGGWFWWGASGAGPYIELWKAMYDRYTNHHQLNNLLWVWNGQHADWYPGDAYVDLMGEDIYTDDRDYSSQKKRFEACKEATGENKIIALTENGVVPDPELLIKDQVYWSWFCTWGGEFVATEDGQYNDKRTGRDMLVKVYNHDYVITKDELPELRAK